MQDFVHQPYWSSASTCLVPALNMLTRTEVGGGGQKRGSVRCSLQESLQRRIKETQKHQKPTLIPTSTPIHAAHTPW